MPRARAGFGAVIVDDKAWLVGGEDAAGNPVAEVDVYSFADNTWSQVAPMPTPRVWPGS